MAQLGNASFDTLQFTWINDQNWKSTLTCREWKGSQTESKFEMKNGTLSEIQTKNLDYVDPTTIDRTPNLSVCQK